MAAQSGHGIGGKIGRDCPMCLPVRMALTNISSVQMPSPVFWSGVKLAANDMPHGPLHAVSVGLVAIAHGTSDAALGGTGILKSSGWPAKALLMSGSGPFGPIFFVVWQS
jgi:hypothetical protein